MQCQRGLVINDQLWLCLTRKQVIYKKKTKNSFKILHKINGIIGHWGSH